MLIFKKVCIDHPSCQPSFASEELWVSLWIVITIITVNKCEIIVKGFIKYKLYYQFDQRTVTSYTKYRKSLIPMAFGAKCRIK